MAVYLLRRFFKIPMDLLPEIRSSSEIYGSVADGILKGVPISGVSKLLNNIHKHNLVYNLKIRTFFVNISV
jgi:hypothetical protein